MAQDQSDIVTANSGSGGPTFATDTNTITSHVFPKSKLVYGTQHQDYFDVEKNYPLPVDLSNAQFMEVLVCILRELMVLNTLVAEGFGAAGDPEQIRNQQSIDTTNVLT